MKTPGPGNFHRSNSAPERFHSDSLVSTTAPGEVTSVASGSTRRAIGVVQYYELPFGSGIFVSDTYHIPTRILRNIFVQLDTRDSPKKPGKVLLSTMTEAIMRFHAVTCAPPYQDPVMRQESEEVCAELRQQAHSRRNRDKYLPDDDDRAMVSWDQDLVFKVFRVKLPVNERLFFTFDISENSTWASQSVSFIIMLSIFLSILTFVIESVPNLDHDFAKSLPYIDMVCVLIFTVDYIVRLATVPWARMQLLDKQFIEDVFTGRIERRLLLPRERLKRFLLAPMGLVDLLSCAPFWVELAVRTAQGKPFLGIETEDGSQASDALRVLRFVRLVRVLKLGKVTRVDLGEDRNMVLQLFGEVVGRAKPALQLVALLILLAMLTFGSLIWFAERGDDLSKSSECPDISLCGRGRIRRRADGDYESSLSPFESIPASFWWVLVTITTVGYGDHYPVTAFGYFIGAATILYGVVVFALPVGIIGTAFSQAYDQILEDQAYRKSLEQEEIETAHREVDKKNAAPNFHEPPAVFVELWITLHRTAMAASIPMAMAKTWQTELMEIARFENLSNEHPCDALERWGTPIFTTLKQHITHLETSAAKYMSRLRVVWYSILFKVSEAHSEFIQSGGDQREFFKAMRVHEEGCTAKISVPTRSSSKPKEDKANRLRALDDFALPTTHRPSVRSDFSNNTCIADIKCRQVDVSPPSLPPNTSNPHKTSL